VPSVKSPRIFPDLLQTRNDIEIWPVREVVFLPIGLGLRSGLAFDADNDLMSGHDPPSAVNFSSMADVDDDHEKFITLNSVNDPITADAVRPKIFKFSFEALALKGIALKIIQGVGKSSIKLRLTVRDPFKHT